ncbi:hypothetical protein CDL15_Pgr007132 [Punica granatum]|uniref:Uncharacterized protein n=1 Tax=Punica granatum TaxID=22663 RepID=A0A218X9B2_PUNGR|nr:hypothetical protein CDL15_Pgr007132 [Punica granatum]
MRITTPLLFNLHYPALCIDQQVDTDDLYILYTTGIWKYTHLYISTGSGDPEVLLLVLILARTEDGATGSSSVLGSVLEIIHLNTPLILPGP